MTDQELQQKFLQYLAKKSGAKSQKDLEKYVENLGEDGLKKAYEEFSKEQIKEKNKAAQKATHGAKLQYVKSLKHQCAEDEEVYYYAKGGNLECGCKKKLESGGKEPTLINKVVDKFRKFRNTKEKLEKEVSRWDKKGNYIVPKKKIEERKEEMKRNPPRPEDEENALKCGGKMKKKTCGGKIKVSGCGSKIKEKK